MELRFARGIGLVALLVLAGCSRGPAAAPEQAEAVVLTRQIANLRQLVGAAEQKTFVSSSWLAVGVEEDVFRRVITAGLPQETTLGGRVQVRIEKATVRFSAGVPMVSLHARVSDVQSTGLFAQVAFRGGLDRVDISPEGKLSTRVAIDQLEGADGEAGAAAGPLPRFFVDALGARGVDWLREILPPVEIPVRLDQEIVINGLSEGPVLLGPGALPVHLKVARVLALGGRLWVLFDAAVGPWSSRPRADSARPVTAAGQK